MARFTPRHARRGSMLLAVAFLLMLILAAGGLMLDLTRILSEHAALQSKLDGAALAAVLELDGTPRGTDRARQAVLRELGKATAVTGIRCEFAQQSGGPWSEVPAYRASVRLVRVRGEARVPLTLLKMVTRRDASHVWAIAAAGQQPQTEFREGLFPYSPLAPDPDSKTLGLVRGALHTLRWADQPSLSQGNVCGGDIDPKLIGFARQGNEGSTAFLEAATPFHIRQAILWDSQSSVRRLGGALQGSAGGRLQELAALVERIGQDSDRSSRTYSEYIRAEQGNGRRLIAAALHSRHPARGIVEVGAFFLLPADAYASSGDMPICAEFVGSYLRGASHRGAADAGYLTAELLR